MTTLYKVLINDRAYTSWTFQDILNNQVNDLNINPAKHKLFSNDVFRVNEDGNIKIEHSTLRFTKSIPGVLILKNNKTYGRYNNKLLYKCVPDDIRLPHFLIPYEIKNVGFSKVFLNMYVTFTFTSWDDKHPHASLDQVIGNVDILDNFYEYQLYCKSLNSSIQKFTKDTSKALKNKSHDAFIENISKKYSSIENRTNNKIWNIFSIDPNGSLDFDDAFSIQDLGEGKQLLSIYIANVTIWLDVLNLWNSFSRRISTIYLPDRKRPMLPTILSDCLCSLQQNCTRIAFVMDITLKENEIEDISYKNCMVVVNKNFIYEESKLLENNDYKYLFDLTKKLSKKFKYINNVKNSHDVVCYLMIFMNYHCAKELLKRKNGIFRSTIMKNDICTNIPQNVPEEVSKHIKIWNSSSGQYIDGSLEALDTRHDILEMDAYIHITSPIRRLVDLLNIIKFQQNFQMINLSQNASSFYDNWLNELEYINVIMRSIRRVQCDCDLLSICSNDPQIMDKKYEGYAFDKLPRNDGLYQYVVFLPDLKLTSRITMRENIENYKKCMFKLYLFLDEENFKKKIRLQMCE